MVDARSGRDQEMVITDRAVHRIAEPQAHGRAQFSWGEKLDCARTERHEAMGRSRTAQVLKQCNFAALSPDPEFMVSEKL